MKGLTAGLTDTDDINQKLWARKRLRERRERNEKAKIKKKYFKMKGEDAAEKDTTEAGSGTQEDKQKKFYKELFAKEEMTDEQKAAKKKEKKKQLKKESEKNEKDDKNEKDKAVVKKDKRTFNKGLDRLKEKKQQKELEKDKAQRQREKKFRSKIRYAHQLNLKTQKGQMRTSGLLDHYLAKIQKGM